MTGDRRLTRLATAALDAMRHGDHAATDRALDQLHARHGMAGITKALVIWCDTALKQVPRGDGPVELVWKDTATGTVHNGATGVLPAEQWAGQLLAARAADDLPTFTALANAVPPDRVGEHVGAMVQMAARIIEGAPRGR